jgi:cell division protein FtsW
MKRNGSPDYLLYAAALVATLFGLIAIWDAGYAESAAQGALIPSGLYGQVAYGFAGIIGAFFLGKIAPPKLRKLVWPIMVVTAVLLVGVLLVGKEVNGATRWYRIGKFSFQPSEVAKLSCVLFMAAGFAGLKPWVQPKVRGFSDWIGKVGFEKLVRAWPLLPILVVFGLIEMQPDLKTGMVILVTAGMMMWVAGVSKKSFATLGICLVVLAGAAIIDKPYRMTRLMSHTERWSDSKIDSIGFQTTQSETALAMGGVLGKGFGQGRAKYTLPEPTNDFVLATIGEEVGLIGSLVVIGLLGFIVFRIYNHGMQRVDRFEKLFLVGVSCWIGIQTIANILVANGAMPVMGVPLPFFSAGGSSLFALWLAIGVSQAMISSPNVRVEKGGLSADESEPVARRAYVR